MKRGHLGLSATKLILKQLNLEPFFFFFSCSDSIFLFACTNHLFFILCIVNAIFIRLIYLFKLTVFIEILTAVDDQKIMLLQFFMTLLDDIFIYTKLIQKNAKMQKLLHEPNTPNPTDDQ